MGYEELKNTLIKTISEDIDDIEIKVKTILKQELKSYTNCGIDPSLPVVLKSTGNGIKLNLRELDYNRLMNVPPSSEVGEILYFDNNALLNSKDFNTYLYNTIQQPNSTTSWGLQTLNQNIIDIEFKDLDTPNNNTLTFNSNINYDNKTLTEFNNDFVDSLTILPTEQTLTNLIDNIFNVTLPSFRKTEEDIIQEKKINDILENIINKDDDETITDEDFNFSSDELKLIEEQATNLKNGNNSVNLCGEFEVSLNTKTVVDNIKAIGSGTTTNDKMKLTSDAIDNISDSLTFDLPETEKETNKQNFIERLLNNITLIVMNSILSPKVIIIFLLNQSIYFNSTSNKPEDFIKNNKTLFLSITNNIKEVIINKILEKVLKEIGILTSKQIANVAKERLLNQQTQLLSLLGVPSQILNKLNNF